MRRFLLLLEGLLDQAIRICVALVSAALLILAFWYVAAPERDADRIDFAIALAIVAYLRAVSAGSGKDG